MSEINQNLTVICLGSNVENRLDNIRRALTQLELWFRVTEMSEYYESDDDSGVGAPYVNMVVGGVALVDRDMLLANVKELECRFGRDESSKSSGVMPLDVDVVIWQGRVVDEYQYGRPYFQHGLRKLR